MSESSDKRLQHISYILDQVLVKRKWNNSGVLELIQEVLISDPESLTTQLLNQKKLKLSANATVGVPQLVEQLQRAINTEDFELGDGVNVPTFKNTQAAGIYIYDDGFDKFECTFKYVK
jgi:hypothetical protein